MKNKGFTLTELLVVIVILGVITGISLPLVRNIQKRNEEKQYINYAESLKYSAKLYTDSYGKDIIHDEVENDCFFLSFEEMNKKNLLKDIAVDNISCDSNNTFVKVERSGNKYTYSVSLECKNTETNEFIYQNVLEKTCGETVPPSSYRINYIMNGGIIGENTPTSAEYDEVVPVNKPSKEFTISIDTNSQGTSITSGGVAVTEVTGTQTFEGWTGTNLTSTAKYGLNSNDISTIWNNGSTKVGASNLTTYFKNLGDNSETVTLTANWITDPITLPKLEKSGYSCTYNTSADGSGTSYESEGTYTPSTTESGITLYVKCIQETIQTIMSLSPASGTLTHGTNGTATITTNGDGALSCTSSNTSVATCSISGTTLTIVPKANTADNKTATITVSQAAGTNYTAASKTYSATVNRKTLTCPSSPTAKTYTGSSQTSGVSCPTGSTAGGDTSATAAGSYSQTCTASSGYKFSSTCSVSWTINKKATTMSLSSTSGTLTYGTNGTATITTNGDGALSCTSSNTSVATCSISGTTLTITPKANTADNKTATITVSQAAGTNYSATSKTYSATVNRKTLTCPSSPTAKTYTGSSQTSGVSCPTGSTAGGNTSATAAGSYSQTCTASSGYKFSSTCSVSWTINKKATTMSLSSTSGTLSCGGTKTVTVTTDGDGALSCTSSNTSAATCSVSGKKVTITGNGSGTATITIKQAAGTNYAAASKTYTATGKKCTTWTFYYYWYGDTAACIAASYCEQPCEYHGYSDWSCTAGDEPTTAHQKDGAYCYCAS